jgi:hypothetical protein
MDWRRAPCAVDDHNASRFENGWSAAYHTRSGPSHTAHTANSHHSPEPRYGTLVARQRPPSGGAAGLRLFVRAVFAKVRVVARRLWWYSWFLETDSVRSITSARRARLVAQASIGPPSTTGPRCSCRRRPTAPARCARAPRLRGTGSVAEVHKIGSTIHHSRFFSPTPSNEDSQVPLRSLTGRRRSCSGGPQRPARASPWALARGAWRGGRRPLPTGGRSCGALRRARGLRCARARCLSAVRR